MSNMSTSDCIDCFLVLTIREHDNCYFDLTTGNVWDAQARVLDDVDEYIGCVLKGAYFSHHVHNEVMLWHIFEHSDNPFDALGDLYFRTMKKGSYTNHFVNMGKRKAYEYSGPNTMTEVDMNLLGKELIEGANFFIPSKNKIVYVNIHDLVSGWVCDGLGPCMLACMGACMLACKHHLISVPTCPSPYR